MRWLVAVAVLFTACGDDDAGPLNLDGAVRDDGGTRDATSDATLPANDAGVGVPPTPLQPSAIPGVIPPADRYEDPNDFQNAGSCYDGEDNDEADMELPDGADCDDADCATLPSCCVGRPQTAACCREVSGRNLLANLEGCTPGGSPLTCVTGASAFGSPMPFVDSGLALGGDGVFDSGLLFDESIDLRTSNLDVTIQFRQAECTGSCRESAAFGITTQDALGTDAHVDPEVALVVSGERHEARLLVADDIVAVWEDVGTGEWQVVLRPDGTIWIRRDGGLLTEVATYEPVGDAHVVAWGHSRNPGATEDDGIRIERLEPHVQVCDMPRAWANRTRLFMQVTDEVGTTGSTSPSVVLDATGMPRMAYAQGGEIFLAMQDHPRPERWARELSPARAEVGTTFGEPELVPVDDGFRLYYFADDGTRTWMIASADASLQNLDAGRALSMPTSTFAHPSIVPIMPPGRSERFAMVASTDRGIETFSSVNGEEWSQHASVPIELLDAAEIGEPSLAVVNGGYQLALAIRRGARWSIVMFASAELVHWLLVDERSLEAGTQTERVGVRDLELYVRGAMLEAVYVGLDGVRDSLHHTSRALPSLL